MSKLYKLSSGYNIPSLALGLYGVEVEKTTEIVYKALEIGYRHFDTADLYKNEQQTAAGISQFLKDHPEIQRSDVFVTTKVNTVQQQGYSIAKKSIDESLEKLNAIDYIDLVLNLGPFGSSYGRLSVYQALQDSTDNGGSVKSIGVANYGIHHLQELYQWEGLRIKPVVNQLELNPWLTRKELIQYMDTKHILAEAFSPLTKGKKLDDAQLNELASKYDKTPAQILIKWSLQKGFIPLPKSSNEDRLKENFAMEGWELNEEDLGNLTHDDMHNLALAAWDPSKLKLK